VGAQVTAIRAALLALLILGAAIVLHAAGGWLLAHPLEGAAVGVPTLVSGTVLFLREKRRRA
jgi:hypothetical protein